MTTSAVPIGKRGGQPFLKNMIDATMHVKRAQMEHSFLLLSGLNGRRTSSFGRVPKVKLGGAPRSHAVYA